MRGPATVALFLVLAFAVPACGGEGGDNPRPAVLDTGTGIENVGVEAEGEEREAILAVFRGSLGAFGAGDFARACSFLASEARRSLRVTFPVRKGKDCAAILARLTAATAPRLVRAQARGEVVAVRVDDDVAFVLFRAPGAKLFQQALRREGGGWKATEMPGSILVPDL